MSGPPSEHGPPNPPVTLANNTNLTPAWARSRYPAATPGLLPRRTVVPEPISDQPAQPTKPPLRRPIDPSLPPNVPTEPVAMRRGAQQITPRRRVNRAFHVTEEPLSPSRPGRRNPNAANFIRPAVPPRIRFPPPKSPPKILPEPPPKPQPIFENAAPTRSNPFSHPYLRFTAQGESNVIPASQPAVKPGMRNVDAKSVFYDRYGQEIIRREVVEYLKSQQTADYANLMSGSMPEQTWETRRGAPMVAPAESWREFDKFSLEWYQAVILSYKKDSARAAVLGGTEQEQAEEKRRKDRGHLAGVSIDKEIKRNAFEADLMTRARNMVLRDNGVMPRNGLGNPAGQGEPQPRADGSARIREEMKARARLRAGIGAVDNAAIWQYRSEKE